MMDEKKVAIAVALLQNPETLVTDVFQTPQVSWATLYQHLPPDGRLTAHVNTTHTEPQVPVQIFPLVHYVDRDHSSTEI